MLAVDAVILPWHRFSRAENSEESRYSGISLPNTDEQKIKQYADDTVSSISSPKSYERIVVAFDGFFSCLRCENEQGENRGLTSRHLERECPWRHPAATSKTQ